MANEVKQFTPRLPIPDTLDFTRFHDLCQT